MDLPSRVGHYEECQTLCRDTADCRGWTWSSQSDHFCFMFSSLGETYHLPGCVRKGQRLTMF